MKVYFNKSIRALVIHSNGHALIFREASPGNCLIEFLPESQLPSIDEFVDAFNKQIFGFIGLIKFKNVIHFGFISGRRLIGTVRDDEDVYQIIDTVFINLNGEITTFYKDDQIQSSQMLPSQSSTSSTNNSGDSSTSHVHSITKLLASGTFYYSPDTDLSMSMKDRLVDNDDYSNRFVWNNGIIDQLKSFRLRISDSKRVQFDKGLFYITIIRGFVDQRIIENGKVLIISKQDTKKSGKLFGPVGMDDDGNVANFVETEIVIKLNSKLFSYLIISGNVPLFWKLDSHLISTKLDFKRPIESTIHIFSKFFESLYYEYGKIFVLDALSAKGSQPELSEKLYNSVKALGEYSPELPITYKKLLNNGLLKSRGNESYYTCLVDDEFSLDELNSHKSLILDLDSNEIISSQNGVIFLTTLFSIERTNFLMSRISEYYLQKLIPSIPDDLWFAHYELWQSNGIALNKLAENYNNSIKAKNKTGGLMGKVAEQSKRLVTGSTQSSSSGKQRQFDRLLGGKNKELQVDLIDPVHDYVFKGLNAKIDEYTQMKDLLIYSVTYNVNGVKYKGDLTELLFPEKEFTKYDLVVVSLQEVIELTPSKVMSIDPEIRNHWEMKISNTLNSDGEKVYSLLRTEQLGGILLLVYANNDEFDFINNIETNVKKTGFKGMSANKGGVAISFDYSGTKLCFIASHLAAGHHNLIERHADYKTISKGIKFSKNKSISNSDIVIWLGDLNYRIQLPNNLVRKMLDNNNSSSPQFKPMERKSSSQAQEMAIAKLDFSESETLAGETGDEKDDDDYQEDEKEDDDDDYKASSSEEKKDDEYEDDIKDETVISTLLSGTTDVSIAIPKLFEFDQLNTQMNSGKTFPFYDEMEIKFKPTYKFDKGTDIYDTSEKQRIPSWTDRILSHNKNKEILQQLKYNSVGSYKFSDHKPVYGIFIAHLEISDEIKKREIEKDLYLLRKNELGNDSILAKSNKELNEDFKLTSVLKHGLPPPSGKLNRWWRSSDLTDETTIIEVKSSKINFKDLDLDPNLIINPNLPMNPFLKTDELDFITP